MSLHQRTKHPEYVEGCFGCKISTLELSPGDAAKPASQKSLDSRLAFYRQAKADGIQPNGTHPVQVEAAYKASETLGKAYDGGTMTRADKVTKSVAEIMKAVEYCQLRVRSTHQRVQ
jgi:hypothetical protein